MGITSIFVLPILVVLGAGVYYVYNEVQKFMSKSVVRNKVVVITDATSGVGTECARLFHTRGARLILCGKSYDKLESLSDALSSASDPRVTFTPKLVLLDFSDMDSMPSIVTEILECFGCVDVLICNSSMKVKAPVQALSLEMDKTIMDVNYFGPVTLAKGVLPSMISRRTGHLLLVNSIQGKLAVPFRTAYAASKHAVQAFFDCLRAEVEESGISVSTIGHTFISALAQELSPSSPSDNPFWTFVYRQLSHGVHPVDLAEEILSTVSRKKREVLLAHPIPRVALYIRSMMPKALDGQIVMEKTPRYFVAAETPARIHAMSKEIKLIVVVRDPVTRAISDYTQIISKTPHIPSFETLTFKNRTTGQINALWSPIWIGLYAMHLERWMSYFPLSQIHFVHGEKLISDPAGELGRVQDFLGLQRIVTDKHFYFNKTKGFPCLKKPEGSSKPHCLGKTKGRVHPRIDPEVIQRLRDFYQPHNMKFYQLAGQDFGWQ